ncbi:sialoadhesin-like [Pangasianodon hypophthalmus]|uniref:sialoadhesin-like n=1 Tax=Pangasianodon hypophthalmus TaxID=310915 RepID=UPI00230708C4|nr:sialoadhesin-like [Pangasianodon hypophthalmus]
MSRNITVAAILMLLTGVQAQHSVTLSSQSLCAVTGSTVKIPCTFTKPYQSSVTQREWYRVQSSEREPQNLSKDPQYSGRVSVRTWWSDCELTLRNVRVSDSGVYNFRFKTQISVWISASSGVRLTVTDLQLKVNPNTVGQREVKVTCSSTCSISTHRYYWYRNGNYIRYTTDASIVLDSTSPHDEGSYSCQVYGKEHRSPPVCVLGKECWGVTYTPEHVCALKDTSIDLSCSYKHPAGHTVIKSVWFIKQQAGVEPEDVREDEEYQGRVQYTHSSQNNCSLRITKLRERDAQTYRFRFNTDDPKGKYTGKPGVSLSVTELKVTVSDLSNGYKNLSCFTTCTLSNNPTYIWYKNGQRVTDRDRNELSVSSEDAGSYSCAVRGHEELRSPAVCLFDKKSCWSVTYSTQTICSLIGSSVDMHSYYTFPDHYKVTKVFWFIKEQVGSEPVDVREDKEYQGRVQYTQSSQNNCSLRITNLRERDAQTYRFRFYTDDPKGKYTGQPGVSLSVTDLKVTASDWRNGYKKLSCFTTCTLSNNPTYIWYKNGQRVTDPDRNELSVSSEDAGSYSCAVRGHEELRSPAVCVSDEKSCWSVTYSTQTICSLIGSSVDILSYYTFPNNQKMTKVFWFIREQPDAEPVDVKEDEEYQGRVQYTQSSQNNCSLRITNLTERDAQTYRFRFYTDDPTGKYTGQPGVSLSVTDLKIMVSDSGSGQKKLSCITTCTLSNRPTYIWYKNGQRVSDCKSASCSVAAVSGAVSYSCAVEGHDSLLSPPVYSPKDTRAVVLSSGHTVEGDSVTLSCSSDANPPVLTYSWFKQRAATDTLLTTGQNYSISSISYQHSGLYYCTARNQLGQHNSTPKRLDVLYSPKNTSAVVLSSGHTVEGGSVTLSCSSDANPPVLTYSWFKQRAAADTLLTTGQNYTISNISSQHSGLYYCTAHNQLGQHNSTPKRLDVLYSPKNTSAVVLSSGDTVEGGSVTLSCSSDANPPVLTYSWFKQRAAADTLLTTGQNYSISNISSQHSGLYYCTAHNQLGQHNSTPTHLDVLYSPKDTRAVVLSSGDTVEGDSVTLSCSSDANPPVLTYSWFKQRAAADTLLTTGQNYTNSSISSQHSGLYYCTARNQLGQHNSTPTRLDVLYSPKDTIAVVLSSGDTVEGDSVTLSCSSDANPPVLTYSWFKQRAAADTLLTTGQNYSISSISSQHSGLYYCTAHNQLGQHNSTPTHLDVLYSPKNTRAVVLSSGDTVEGGSVTLSCSSDANPPVLNYSWFKQRAAADTLLTTGQNYTISNISSQHSGLYYCTAHNQLGQHNSTPTHLDVLDSPKNTSAVILSSGDTVEGDSVTLSCSSDANPPVLTYSWFKQRADADTLLTTGQNYSISSISSQHSGLYYCTAHNQLGQHNSTPTHLDVLHSPKDTSAVVLSSGDIVEGESVTLSCRSDANPPVLTYSWFKQRAAADTLLTIGQNYSISSISSQHSGLYYCTAHNQLGQHNSTPTRLDVLDSPKDTRAVVLSSGHTVEGDSVTLSCSSDANPPLLNYTWFKQRAAADTLLTTGQNYTISSISSQHSGLYYCTARNQLGQHNSTPKRLDVLYSPKDTSAVVLSSGDTVEGGSVTLSCSSDANPPVLTYSWFKQRAAADTLLTTGQNYTISNISSQHSGLYYCTAHNQLGQHNSTPTRLDVLYFPKNTSAVVLSSGDTVEGGSVTLSCSSDANPPLLNYTWFKQRAAADTLLTTGQNYTISSISSQHSGLYYCTARNQLGQHNSTPTHLDALCSEENTGLKVILVGLVVFLAVTLLSGALWMWKRKRSSANGHSSTGDGEQPPSAAVYENVPASNLRGRVASDDQDNVHYASVVFNSHTQEQSLSPRLPPDTTEEEDVQYAAVNFSRNTAAIQLVADEAAEDSSQIYSKIQKITRKRTS